MALTGIFEESHTSANKVCGAALPAVPWLLGCSATPRPPHREVCFAGLAGRFGDINGAFYAAFQIRLDLLIVVPSASG